MAPCPDEIPIISAAQFRGTVASSVTAPLNKAQNELRMEAKVAFGTPANRLDHMVYFERVNTFAETSLEQSNCVKIFVKALTLPLLTRRSRRKMK
jgi:hypothetical protein